MKKVLFVDCCIRREASRSKELAEYFIQKLEETGAYEIERLCLMDENLSYFSDGFFFQREALLAEGKFDHPRFRYAHRFAAADKIVIAAPFWDLSFPALLKVYIENLCVDGITFHSDETGLHGLCKADHMVFPDGKRRHLYGFPHGAGRALFGADGGVLRHCKIRLRCRGGAGYRRMACCGADGAGKGEGGRGRKGILNKRNTV